MPRYHKGRRGARCRLPESVFVSELSRNPPLCGGARCPRDLLWWLKTEHMARGHSLFIPGPCYFSISGAVKLLSLLRRPCVFAAGMLRIVSCLCSRKSNQSKSRVEWFGLWLESRLWPPSSASSIVPAVLSDTLLSRYCWIKTVLFNCPEEFYFKICNTGRIDTLYKFSIVYFL